MKNNKLSECEEQIISILMSSKEDLTLLEVTEQVNKKYNKDWKIQTVATFLTRLERKNYINIYRIGRFSHYHLIITRDNYILERIKELADKFFDGNTAELQNFIKNTSFNSTCK